MASMNEPVVLDALDGRFATFSGNEIVIGITRDAWTEMGCPTMLELTIAPITTDDRSSL